MSDSKIQLEGTAPEIGNIAYVERPFDQATEDLKVEGFTNISARDLAAARIALGYNHSMSQMGSYVKEGDLYIPQNLSSTGKTKVLFLRDSLVLQNSSAATNAHRNRVEYFVDKKSAELQEQAGTGYESPVFEFPSNISVPTNRDLVKKE